MSPGEVTCNYLVACYARAMDYEPTTDAEGNDVPDKTAVVSIDMDAVVDDVWDALTTDDGLAPWMGEGASVGSGVGGPLSAPDIATGRHRFGFIEEFTPGEELAFRWWPEDDPELVTCVSIALEPQHGRTRVTVTETAPAASSASLGSLCPLDWQQRMNNMVSVRHLAVYCRAT